uniref:FBA_2 domain-containing protein n=1 Tax=Caenorhabditis tropicalis TaxID=1561998 RepID=A0A1I7TJE5_9PELO
MQSGQPEKFPFFKLPDLPLLDIIRQMNTVDACQFDEAYDDFWKTITRKQVSLGDVALLLDRTYSSVQIGNFTWVLSSDPTWADRPKVVKTLGPVTMEVIEKEFADGDTWFSEAENTLKHALELVNWMLNKFPKHRLLRISCALFMDSNDEVLDLLESLNIEKFECCRLMIPIECQDERANAFFDNKIKKWDANLIKTVHENKKVATMTNFGTSLVPIDKSEWFSLFIEQDKDCNYMILRNVNVNEDFLNAVITKWINLKYKKLVLVKIKYLGTLNKSKILSQVCTKKWDKEDINRHINYKLFEPYVKGNMLVVENKKSGKAAIRIDEESKTFTLAIFDTKAKYAALQIIQNTKNL